MTSEEPRILADGKKFHKLIQQDWQDTAEGDVSAEKTIATTRRRKGRMDLFVSCDEDLVSIVEIKNSDWDKMTLTAVKRNVRRQARQLWKYIEAYIQQQGKDVCPGIIFRKRPKIVGRLELVERLFEEEGVPVVWDDEIIEERKAR